MLPDPALLTFSIGLAGLVGFAAAHGGICAVQAIDDLLDGRGGALFLAFLKCSIWVAATTLPLAWTVLPDGHLASGYPLAWPVAAGGFVFGVGAALNGGCAFSTVSHLGSGDFGQIFALLGLCLGYLLHDCWIVSLLPSAAPQPDLLAQPEPWLLALLGAALVWGAREALRLRRSMPNACTDRTMAVIGVANGGLCLLHAPWMYTAGLSQGAAWVVRGGPAPSALLPLHFAGTLAGAALAARASGRFRPRLPRAGTALFSLAGGLIMGTGAALVPGGNDALVLHGFPSLLPHAALASAALVVGAACARLLLRALRGFGQEKDIFRMAQEAILSARS